MRNLVESLKGEYPHLGERRQEVHSLQVTGRIARQERQDLGVEAFILKSESQLNLAQFRVDGFTFNRLRPYESWAVLFPEAMRLWTLYVQYAAPVATTRIAVRYINHLELPDSVTSLEEVLRIAPRVPETVTSYLTTFLTRMTIHDPRLQTAANVGLAFETSDGRPATVLFDIDAYHQTDLPPDSTVIPEKFEDLRQYKNDIFFGGLTDMMIEIYR